MSYMPLAQGSSPKITAFARAHCSSARQSGTPGTSAAVLGTAAAKRGARNPVMAEILDSDDDSVCDLTEPTEPEVIDLSADDTDLAAQLNAQLDEYIVIDSDSDDDDDVQFVSQSPPKRRKVDEEEVTFVKSTPPVHDVDADEALARKLHEQINGDVEVVARPTPKPSAAKKKTSSSKKRPKNEGPFGGRDVLKKQRVGLFDFLSKKAKSLRIVDVVPNPHSEPGKPLYERFLSAYTFAKTKKVKLLFHGSPFQAVHKSNCRDTSRHRRDASPDSLVDLRTGPKTSRTFWLTGWTPTAAARRRATD